MAIFGRSLFQSVLERIVDEKSTPKDEKPGSPIHGSIGGFVVQTGDSIVAEPVLTDAYRDFASETKPKQMPSFLARLDIAEVSADLGVGAGDTARSLAIKRRAFARLNHPDRVDIDYRAQATIRMTIANQLIDAALQALKS